jgi:hypothetical protein
MTNDEFRMTKEYRMPKHEGSLGHRLPACEDSGRPGRGVDSLTGETPVLPTDKMSVPRRRLVSRASLLIRHSTFHIRQIAPMIDVVFAITLGGWTGRSAGGVKVCAEGGIVNIERRSARSTFDHI